MSTSIIVYQQEKSTHVGELIFAPVENPYRRFFDFEAARQSVLDHIAALPSSRTPEHHTQNCYIRDLDKFIAFLDARLTLPSESLVQSFIAMLAMDGCKSSTIGRYMAPVRHFCRALANQPLRFDELPNDTRVLFGLIEQQNSIKRAADMPNPKIEIHTDEAPLDAYGHRLSVAEINTILGLIDRTTLLGKRDYALLLTGFYTGLRVAELARITLDSIRQESPDTWSIRVRGKRSKVTPVAVPSICVRAIQDYVTTYNRSRPIPLIACGEGSGVGSITPSTPIWMPLTRSGGVFKKSPRPMTSTALGNIVSRRSEAGGVRIAAHDMRRTWASLARDAEMDMDDIQQQLRHASLDMTNHYIGKKRNYEALNLSSYGVLLG